MKKFESINVVSRDSTEQIVLVEFEPTKLLISSFLPRNFLPCRDSSSLGPLTDANWYLVVVTLYLKGPSAAAGSLARSA